jgi:MFS family permease
VNDPAGPPTAVLRSRRVAVAVQFAAMGTTTGSWAARIPGVREQIGIADAQWGLATLASTAGSLVSMLVVMGLISRSGPKRLASAGVLLLIVNAPLLAAAHGVPHLVLGLLVQGVSTGLLAPGMNAQAVEVEREYGRRIMSTFHACFSVGQLAGGVAGSIAAHAGVSPTGQLVGSGIVLLVLLAATWTRLPPDPPRHPSAAVKRPLRQRVTGQLLLLAVISLLASVNEGAATQWSAQYTAGYLAAGAGLGALTFTCFSIAMALSRAFGDRLVNRIGQRRFIVLSEIAVAAGMAAGLASGTVAGALIGFAVLGLGSACVVPSVMGLAGNQPGVPSGEGVSVVSLGQWPAILVGPPIIGAVSGLVGLRWSLFVLVGAAAVIVVLARWIRVPVHREQVVASSG